MRTRHLIDTAVFDIGFSDEETAFQTQAELKVFIKRKMMSVVDETFDEASKAGFVMRIPSLEVDLGSVAYQDYQDELPRRLRERLKALLAEFRVTATGGAAPYSSVIDKRRAEYEQLQYFLLTGHLPWYSSLVDEVDLEGLLGRALRDNATRLKNFLQTTPHRHQAVARLVGQFSAAGIAQLFHSLAPSHAPLVNELMEKLTLAWRRDSTIVNALGLSHEDAVGELWLVLIEIVLGQDGHQYSAQELLARALRTVLFEKHKINRKVVAAFVAQTAQPAHADLSTVNVVMQELLQEQASQQQGLDENITGEHGSLQSVDATGRDRSKVHDREGLRAILVTAIMSGDATAIDSVWEHLLSKHGAMLEQVLRHDGQQAKVRKRLAYGFSEAQLRDILELLEPTEHGFVTTVIEQHDRFRPRQGGQAHVRERTVRQVWEFSLGYILVERGSRFNKKSYLASILRQLAASENMNFQDLLDDLLENMGTYVGSKTLGRQMRQLILELREEQRITSEVTVQSPFLKSPLPSRERARERVQMGWGTERLASEEAKISNSQELRAYALYDQLNQALVDGVATVEGGQAGLVKVIDELRHDYPAQLLRILRELQSGAIRWSSAPTGISTVLLRKLVLAFLELTSQTGPGGGSELVDAVIANAERATLQNQYWRRLLTCLIKGELIDFEAIRVGTEWTDRASGAPGDREDADELDSLANQSALLGITDDQVEEKLRQFLRGNIELSPAEAASMINGITRLLERQPQRFLQSFVLKNPDEQRIARLIGLLPERLLARIAAELAGQPTQRIQQYTELITTACQGKQIGVRSVLLRRLKWEFIFAYLAAGGRVSNEQGFIRRYVETLIELTQQDDPQQFLALLCQQLVVNILPSTRDASHRIVDLLSNPVDDGAGQQADTTALIDEAARAQPQELRPLEEVYITNAGIVLATPYLPRLFEMLGLTEKSAFKDRGAELRAVHMLQYLVNENTASPEYQLFLNKLLCGVKTDAPIRREIELTEHEKEVLNGLLQGMIENWKVLGNTSVAGLREAFLQRQGRLQLRDDAWHLLVEPKAFDMLLDQLPWGFSTIKYPWMERVIYVEWR